MQLPHFWARTNYRAVNRSLKQWAVFTGLLAFVFLPVTARAQFRGSIQGVVTDTQGGVIPGATLTLTNVATNETKTAVTNGTGVYNFGALPPATFRLVISAKGFQTQTMENVHIIPEQANALNVHLALSTVVTSVTVNAAQMPLMDTETPNIGATITSNEVQHMPSFGRDVFQLTQLTPGTISDMSQAGGGGTYTLPGVQSGAVGPSANSGIFATENGPQVLSAGNQFENNGIQVDGISTASAVWGGSTVVTPSEESVESVRVVSNDYSAEEGRFSGAQIEVTSKSGTNTIHGSAFFQAWRPGLNAYQRYNGPASLSPGTPATRGLLRDTQQFNQFGGSVGGPIWKNHVFAFFSYETERNNSNVTGTEWYETPAFDGLAPSGSIASTYLSFPGNRPDTLGMINQTCSNVGLVEGKNCVTIPGQGLNIGSPLTTGLGTQDLTWTGPSNPGTGGGINGITADIADYTTVNPTNVVDDQYNGRLDADAGSKDHIAFTIYWVPVAQTYYNDSDRTYNLWHHDGTNDAFAGIWNHTFSPNFLNEARANAAGWRWNEVNSNPQAPFGLPEDSVDQVGNIQTGSFANWGAGGPSILDQWTYSYNDVATWVVRNHTIKFGGEATRLYYLNANPSSARPNFNFFNIWDFLNDAPQSENGNFDPATGIPSLGRQDNRENLWGFFVQDDWKATPALTLNLGLRYSYFGPLGSKEDNLYKVVFGTGTDLLTGLTVQRSGSLWNPQHLNLGPQFGFTYSPLMFRQRFVVRGGYGLNYNAEEIAISANEYANPGLTVTPNFTMSSPTSPNPGIVYAIPSNPNSLYGYPPNPNVISPLGPNGLPTAGALQVQAFPNTMPTDYTEHYSLDTETDLGWQFVLTVGYQGSLMRHTFFHLDGNAAASVEGIPLNSSVNSVNYYNNTGHGNYNAMLVELKHQLTHTFLLDGQFTWANSMDTSSAPYEEEDYPYDTDLDYGRSDYNINKQGRIFGMWQPVIFHGSHSWAEKIVGGWSLSGVYNLHSGFPWTPIWNAPASMYCSTCGYYQLLPTAYLGGAGHDTSNDAFKSGPGVGNGVNKNFPLAASDMNAYAYFTPPTPTAGSVFPATGGAPAPLPGIRRNSWHGPGYRNVDATVSKMFGMPYWKREGAGIEIRADAFNLFNNLNFNPTSIINDISLATFGQAQTALGSRTVTLQARFQF